MRRVVGVLVLGLVLVACGSSGAPESFADQPGELPTEIREYADELVGTSDAGAVPLVQRNFLEACMTGDVARSDGLAGRSLASACGCSYDALVSYLIDNTATEEAAFETFLGIDDVVDNDDGEGAAGINERYIQLFQECRDSVG